jgi:predicted transcriptional regulator
MTQPPTHEDAPQNPSLDEYHRALIEEGIRQSDAGEVIEHQTVMSKLAGRRPPKQALQDARVFWGPPL